MLCYRCGSHVNDEADKCWNCGSDLSRRKKDPTRELTALPRTGSRVFSVVYKAGDLIADRYRVLDIVGSGGAGVVYRARDQQLDADIAVKVINGKLVQTADERRLLSRQTKIAKKLSHQNCVRLYDDGMDGERPYFTMQHLDGLSLRRIIDLRREKGQAFTPEEVDPIINQLCQALDYAHGTTFHGNLKPDNILVLPDLLKITDFALLRGLPRKPFLALQKARGDNFRYLAPEVRLEVAELNRAVDIYSLGVILGEMLAGGVIIDDAPEGIEKVLASVPAALADVVRKATARAPKDRFRTPGAMFEAFVSAMRRAAGTKRDAAPQARRTIEELTHRLDIEEAEAPAIGSELREELSVSLAIDDDMIEHESTARSEETFAAAVPLDEEDLIDNPAATDLDAEEEDETLALEEPDQDIRDLRARVEARMADARPKSVLEEISNSAIELLPRAPSVGDGSRHNLSENSPSARTEPKITDPVPQRDAVTAKASAPSGSTAPEPTVANGRGTASGASAAPEPEQPDVPRNGGQPASAEPTVRADDAAALERTVASSKPPAPRTGETTGDPAAVASIAAAAESIAAALAPAALKRNGSSDPATVAKMAAAADAATDGVPDAAAIAAAHRAAEAAAGPRATDAARPALRVQSDTSFGGESSGEAEFGAEATITGEPGTAVGHEPLPAFQARSSSVATEATRHGDLVGRGPVVRAPSSWPQRGGVSEPSVQTLGTEANGSMVRPSVTPVAQPPEEREEGQPVVGPMAGNGAARAMRDRGPTLSKQSQRRSKPRPMTRPRMPIVAPTSPAVPMASAESGLETRGERGDGSDAAPSPVVVTASPSANRLVYFTVAASFLLILVAFVLVVKITTDQQRQNQAEIAALRQQIAEATALAQTARAKEQEAMREVEARSNAALKAQQRAERADREIVISARAQRAAEEAAAAKEAKAEKLRAAAAATADLRARRRAEREAAAAAKAAQARREAAAAEEQRARDKEKEKRAAQAALEREAAARAAAELRAEDERRRAAAAQAAAERLRRGARTPIIPGQTPRKRSNSKDVPAEVPVREMPSEPVAALGARVPVVDKDTRCPSGMKLIEGGAFMMGSLKTDPERDFDDLPYASVDVPAVCIDYYEYPNGRGRQPRTKVTWRAAVKQCERRGKRLCSEAEWERACKGPGGYRYAYGNQWRPDRCNTRDEDGNDRPAAVSGSFAQCRSKFGVIDMAGNVAEWTSTAQGSRYVVKGGGADRPGYASRCASRSRKKANYSSELIGFRCCKDPS